jgi:hypothetical protein
MAETSFSDAMKSIPKSKFKSAAKKERPGFKRCTAPDGDYIARLIKVRRGSNEKGAFVSFDFVILEGEYAGQNPGEFMGLSASGKRTVEMAIAGLHWYTQDFGYETDETWGPDEFNEAFDELTKDQPVVKIQISNNGNFQNVRVVELLDESEVESTVATEDEVTEDEETETETETEDDEAEVEAAEEAEASALTDEQYETLESMYNNEQYEALWTEAANLGSVLDANDFETWEAYWLAVVSELVG